MSSKKFFLTMNAYAFVILGNARDLGHPEANAEIFLAGITQKESTGAH